MDIYISESDGSNALYIPVLPEKLAVKFAKRIVTVEIIDVGEVDFVKGTRLEELSFSSHFPAFQSEWIGLLTPALNMFVATNPSAQAVQTIQQYIQIFYNWSKNDVVLHLVLGEYINMQCQLHSFEPEFEGGSVDLAYSVTFRRHVVMAAKQSVSGVAKVRQSIPAPRAYVTRPGDSLALLAKTFYGSTGNWNIITDQPDNARVLGNPSPAEIMPPDMKLILP
jgi:LysM repeat protein